MKGGGEKRGGLGFRRQDGKRKLNVCWVLHPCLAISNVLVVDRIGYKNILQLLDL